MFKGAFTALVTPFDDSGAIDEKALRELVDRQIAGGISGLVPVGTTGESPTVTHEENIRVVEIVADQASGRVPVIAGTGSNSTAEAVEMTKRAAEVGATASLQVCPYYNKPNQEGLYRHFAAVADAADLPIVIYNIPGRTARNIENDTILRLAEKAGVVAVKEATGSMPQVMDLIARKDTKLSVLSGDDNLTFPICALGGDGVISVASNLIPDKMSRLVSLLADGHLAEARKLHYKLLPFFKSVFADTNPIPIKYALSVVGLIKLGYRLPLVEPSDAVKEVVRAAVASLEEV